VTVDAHKPIDIPHSNSYTDTVVQFAINSIICPDLQMSWQGKQVLGPIDGRQVGVRATRRRADGCWGNQESGQGRNL